MTARKIKSGVFAPPFYAPGEDPTLCIERDLQLCQFLDQLGFDEFWMGEHHSGGWQLIGSPDLFIAAAAERTRRIMLGTGVVVLPYHHPLMVAQRIVQLDHQTRGRVILGVGPGLLPSDAKMLGIPISERRDRTAQSLEIILRLMAGEVVTEDLGWCKLVDARLQLLPYSQPRPEIAVLSMVTPFGGTLAGRLGCGLICLAAASSKGHDNLAVNWAIAEEIAAEQGRQMDRGAQRIVAPMHIAETREKARADVELGYGNYLNYRMAINPPAGKIDTGLKGSLDEMIKERQVVVGTPDDALAQMERVWEKTGGFGVWLQMAHNWADFEATKRSYELYARYVIPKFEARNRGREAALEYVRDHGRAFAAEAQQAIVQTFEKHGRKFET